MPLLDVSHPCALECVNDLHLFMLHHSRATFSCFFFQACKNGRRPTRASTRFSWFSRLTCAKILFNRLMNMCRQEKWYLGTIMDRQSVNQILAHFCTLWCLFSNEILMWLAATTVLYFNALKWILSQLQLSKNSVIMEARIMHMSLRALVEPLLCWSFFRQHRFEDKLA